jgi:hypothetical protein
MRILATPAALILLGASCFADEAVLRDGRHMEGRLKTEAAGRLHFAAKQNRADVPLANIERIRFVEAPLPSAVPVPLQIHLGRGQHFTGELVALDEKTVTVCVPWSKELQVPRRAVASIRHPPGFVTLFHEDFETDSVALKLIGSPSLDDKRAASGRRSLVLQAAGQSATYSLPTPIDAGRIGIRFHDPGETNGARWLLDARFSGKHRAQVLLVGAGDHYKVQTDLAGASKDAKRAAGWHDLSIRFSCDYLLVGVDDLVIFESGENGPGAPLKEIRLACVVEPETDAVRGAVHFDDLTVAKNVPELAHEGGDGTQDELWLLGGDQLFGQVQRADRRAVDIRGSFGKRSVPWSAMRGYFSKLRAAETHVTDGEHVRIGIANGLPEADELEGVVRALDERKLLLAHSVLGEITFDRDRLRYLRPLFFGRRIELDNGRHHLGDAECPVPNVVPSRAEGPILRRTVQLDAIPPSARIALIVHSQRAIADGPRSTEIFLNGERIDSLGRHVDRGATGAVPVSIAIPSRWLRKGDNVVEVRQLADANGHRVSCVVSDLALELPLSIR